MVRSHSLSNALLQAFSDAWDGHDEVSTGMPRKRHGGCLGREVAWELPQKHQRWSSFLDADATPSASSGAKPPVPKGKTKLSEHGDQSTGSSNAAGEYNPKNRQVFLVAMPVTVAVAAFFEYSKESVSETDLSAPVPKVIEEAEKEEESSSLSSAIKVMEPYIRGPSAFKCAGYTTVHLILMGVSLYVDVALTQWNGVFWSALQDHKAQKFYSLLLDFAVITGVTGFIGTYSDYLNAMWQLHARDHLTRHFNRVWLGDGAMSKMRWETGVDNPDQRIEQDIDEFCASTRGLIFGALGATVRLGVYLPMLVSSAPTPLLGFVFVWPVFGAIVTHSLGKTLVPLSVASQSANANFRSALVHTRDKADSLALMQAELQVEQTLQSHFEIMKRVAYAQLDVVKVLNFFKMLYEEYGAVVPLVLLSPAYFSGAIDLGSLMQLRMVIARVSESLTFPVNAYEQAVGWRAAADRLAMLQAQAQKVNGGRHSWETLDSQVDRQVVTDGGGNFLEAMNVSISTAQGKEVVTDFNLQVESGERVLVVVPSTLGKTLLVRAIAGLWNHMSGKIQRPSDCMFVQGFDFPPLSLRGLLAYPHTLDGDLEIALRMVGAGSLEGQKSSLHELVRWEDVLSREQQERIQLARLLLRVPQIAVLDEPLESLSQEEACQLLSLVQTSVLTFSSNRRLESAHTRVVELDIPSLRDEMSHESAARSFSRPRKGARPARLGAKKGEGPEHTLLQP